MFGLFNKKKESPKPEIPAVTSILCIPGNWEDRQQLQHAIVECSNGEYLFAGLILQHISSKRFFELEVEETDPNVTQAFQFGGRVTCMTDEDQQRIAAHRSVVYLKYETGTLEKAMELAQAASVLLRAGGLGVKVETSGKAFSANRWLELTDAEESTNVYELYVLDSLNDGPKTYSCGMHNLGMKDLMVYDEPFQEAHQLIRMFNYFQLVDNPVLNAGETFSTEVNAPMFRIGEEPDQPCAGLEYFENPFGMWNLKRKTKN